MCCFTVADAVEDQKAKRAKKSIAHGVPPQSSHLVAIMDLPQPQQEQPVMGGAEAAGIGSPRAPIVLPSNLMFCAQVLHLRVHIRPVLMPSSVSVTPACGRHASFSAQINAAARARTTHFCESILPHSSRTASAKTAGVSLIVAAHQL